MPSIFVWCTWSWSTCSCFFFPTSSCYVPLLSVRKDSSGPPGSFKNVGSLLEMLATIKIISFNITLKQVRKLQVQTSSGMKDLNLCLWHSLCLEGAKGHALLLTSRDFTSDRSKTTTCRNQAAVSLTATARSSHFAEDCEGTHEPSGEAASVSRLKLRVEGGIFGVLELNHGLNPGTLTPTIFWWLFQLDDEPNLHMRKWLEITKHPFKKTQLFGVPG